MSLFSKQEHELDDIGSKFGSRNVQCTGKDVEDMFLELGHHCGKAYRMTPEVLVSLHAMLEEAKLREKFSKSKQSALRQQNDRTEWDCPNQASPELYHSMFCWCSCSWSQSYSWDGQVNNTSINLGSRFYQKHLKKVPTVSKDVRSHLWTVPCGTNAAAGFLASLWGG